jgi:hypothetical protein
LFKYWTLFLAGFFNSWQLALQKVREENARAQNLARILQKNKLGRILQAWRVVNQEECIIEPLVKRRVRRDTARCEAVKRRKPQIQIYLSKWEEMKKSLWISDIYHWIFCILECLTLGVVIYCVESVWGNYTARKITEWNKMHGKHGGQ